MKTDQEPLRLEPPRSMFDRDAEELLARLDQICPQVAASLRVIRRAMAARKRGKGQP
jgi:hypothetical protein